MADLIKRTKEKEVLRAIDVGSDLKDLYVKFEVEDNIQRTKTIRAAPDEWDERLPMQVSCDTS